MKKKLHFEKILWKSLFAFSGPSPATNKRHLGMSFIAWISRSIPLIGTNLPKVAMVNMLGSDATRCSKYAWSGRVRSTPIGATVCSQYFAVSANALNRLFKSWLTKVMPRALLMIWRAIIRETCRGSRSKSATSEPWAYTLLQYYVSGKAMARRVFFGYGVLE